MRILLADDHALFRDGLASLVAAWGHEMIAMVGTGPETVALAEAAEPDLVLMDVRMPGGGIAATSAIKTLPPDVAIVMLTVSEDEEDLSAAVKAGASGYLLKKPARRGVPGDAGGGRAGRGGPLPAEREEDPRGVRPPSGCHGERSRAGAADAARARRAQSRTEVAVRATREHLVQGP